MKSFDDVHNCNVDTITTRKLWCKASNRPKV